MATLSCYLLRQDIDGRPAEDFDDYIDDEGHRLLAFGPVSGAGFSAKLYVSRPSDRTPTWAPFLQSGFVGSAIPEARSVSAVLVVRLDEPLRYFAFPFGVAGRHFIRPDARRRAAGLRTALNLIYPSDVADDDEARVLAVTATRHARQVLRSVQQSSRAVTLDDFDLDRFHKLVSAATGRPADTTAWGSRVSGGESIRFTTAKQFRELASVCVAVEAAHDRSDYRERFEWIDDITPVTEPDEVARLQEQVMLALRDGDTERFHLAPPEVVDWPSIAGFRFRPGDAGREPRMDPELGDYLALLGDPRSLDTLRRHRLAVVDDDGSERPGWPVWRCLVGQLELDGRTFVLDEGDFFVVARDYLEDLDTFVAGLDDTTIVLPGAPEDWLEDDYNRHVVEGLEGAALLLHEQAVKTKRMSSRVEICDVLLSSQKLVHVKRSLASRGLSHLFAQGAVSAELLHQDIDFRTAAAAKVATLGNGQFGFLSSAPIDPRNFHVVYAIIARWNGRTLPRALPFFSKVSLRQSAIELQGRGFEVSCIRVEVLPSAVGDRGRSAR
jgi:uncharacterized protein (TIGR04141 family)